jgi:hypothetical protein
MRCTETKTNNIWEWGGYDGTPNQWEGGGKRNVRYEYYTMSTEELDESTNI